VHSDVLDRERLPPNVIDQDIWKTSIQIDPWLRAPRT
jgi:hypothetical protein